jgi:hypothetical protein
MCLRVFIVAGLGLSLFVFFFNAVILFKVQRYALSIVTPLSQNFNVTQYRHAFGACLVVVVPTVQRRGGIVYIHDLVESLNKFATENEFCVDLKVFNMRPGLHNISRKGKLLQSVHLNNTIATQPDTLFFRNRVHDVDPLIPTRILLKSESKTRQLLDFPRWMGKFETFCHNETYYLMLEDDFVVCDNFQQHLTPILAMLFAHINRAKFRGLRIGPGLSGIFLRCRDIAGDAQYVSQTENLPVDLALAKHWSTSNSLIHTYRFNTMSHIGIYS